MWISDLYKDSFDNATDVKSINLKAIRAFARGGEILLTPANATMSTTRPDDGKRQFSVQNCASVVRTLMADTVTDDGCQSGDGDKDPWIRLAYNGNPNSLDEVVSNVVIHNIEQDGSEKEFGRVYLGQGFGLQETWQARTWCGRGSLRVVPVGLFQTFQTGMRVIHYS